MARPPTISTDEILAAAREVFLERGLDVPTAEIARRACVSEGSIFKRFATKQALFLAAMGLGEAPEWVEALAGRAGREPVQHTLRRAICEGIEFFRQHVPQMMLLWSSRELAPHEVQQRLPRQMGPRRVLELLTGYVEQEVQAGRIRAARPEIVARAVLAAIANYAFFETIGVQARGPLDADTYAEEIVQMLWHGVDPGTSTQPAPAQLDHGDHG